MPELVRPAGLNRRGPGHLIVCLLVAREDGQVPCGQRRPGRTQNTKKSRQGSGSGTGRRGLAGRRMLRASRHPVPLLPWRRAPAPAPPAGPQAEASPRVGTPRPRPTSFPPPLPPPAPPSILSQTCSPCARPAGSAGMVRVHGWRQGPRGLRGCREQRLRASLPGARLPLRPRDRILELGFLVHFVLLNRERTARGAPALGPRRRG